MRYPLLATLCLVLAVLAIPARATPIGDIPTATTVPMAGTTECLEVAQNVTGSVGSTTGTNTRLCGAATTDWAAAFGFNSSLGITAPPANSTALTISGASHTGSDTTPDISFSGTWNTTGAIAAALYNFTCTSCSSADFVNYEISGASQLAIKSNGNLSAPFGGITWPSSSNAPLVIVGGPGIVLEDTNSASVLNIYLNNNTGVDMSINITKNNVFDFGQPDAPSPTPQTVGAQNVSAGTLNTPGALLTLQDSAGTGTGTSGGYQWQTAPAGSTGSAQNTEVDTMDLTPAALTIKVPAILSGPYSAAGTALPTCNSSLKGALAYVSDATSPTYNGTYTSGGSVTVPVFCSGSTWLTH